MYLRQSQDRTGHELGVSRQRKECQRVITARGWRIVAEYVDNDVSASKVRGPKSSYGRLMADVKAGTVAAVVCYDLDRLTRRPREIEDWIDAAEKQGVRLITADGEVDAGTDNGRLFLRIKAAVARSEVERKSARQRLAAAQAADKGKRVGGRRPFGYEADGVTVRDNEAAGVRAAYDSVLAGVPLGRIARDWNASGLSTPQARYAHGCGGTCADGVTGRSCPSRKASEEPSPWTGQSLRSLLLNPRYAGLRSHVTGRALQEMNPRAARLAGVVGKAEWEELVSEETFRAVVELLTDPSRANPAHAGQRLLTGVALCGVCKATVHAGGAAKQPRGEQYGMYRCSKSTGHVSRASGPADWWVGELVIGRLSRKDASALLEKDTRPDAGKLRREASALRARIDGLAGLLAEGVLTVAGVRRESEKLRGKLLVAESALADSGRVGVLGPLVGAEDVRSAWEALDTDRRRAVIEALFLSVVLLPPGRGTRYGQTVESWETNVDRIKASILVEWH